MKKYKFEIGYKLRSPEQFEAERKRRDGLEKIRLSENEIKKLGLKTSCPICPKCGKEAQGKADCGGFAPGPSFYTIFVFCGHCENKFMGTNISGEWIFTVDRIVCHE
ncbi:MAG: hypothetical protein ABIJ19_00110 [Patescibacteria group bacterium]